MGHNCRHTTTGGPVLPPSRQLALDEFLSRMFALSRRMAMMMAWSTLLFARPLPRACQTINKFDKFLRILRWKQTQTAFSSTRHDLEQQFFEFVLELLFLV